jgi:hypothetical protein
MIAKDAQGSVSQIMALTLLSLSLCLTSIVMCSRWLGSGMRVSSVPLG